MNMTTHITHRYAAALIFSIGLLGYGAPAHALEDPYTTAHSDSYTTTQNVQETRVCTWEVFNGGGGGTICEDSTNPGTYRSVQYPADCTATFGTNWVFHAYFLQNNCTGDFLCGNGARASYVNYSYTEYTGNTITETTCHYIDQVNSWSACVGGIQTAVDVHWTTTTGNSCAHVPLVQSCTPPADPDFDPIGFHDTTSCTESSGWTCDANDYTSPLTVEFYDGVKGAGGTLIGSTLADVSREAAVGANCGGNRDHGFVFTTPQSIKDGIARDIYAYALNDGAGNDTLLTGSPRTLQCGTPPACNDGTDNDGDSETDYPADDGCTSDTDSDETDPVPPPTVTLEVARDNETGSYGAFSRGDIVDLLPNEHIQLQWSSTNADSCTKTFTSGTTVSGDESTVTEPDFGDTSVYQVSCSGAGGGPVSDSISVYKPYTGPDITADDQSIRVGETLTLDWDVNGNDPASCTITETTESGLDDTYATALSASSGSETLTVNENNTYTISCPGGNASVNVYALPAVYEI